MRLTVFQAGLTLAFVVSFVLPACGDDAAENASTDASDTTVADLLVAADVPVTADVPTPQDVAGPTPDAPDARPDVVEAPRVITAGESTLVIDAEGLTWRHAGDVRVWLPLAAFELGCVPALDPLLNYDPYFFEDGVPLKDLYTPPDGLTWQTVTAVADVSEADSGLDVTLALSDDREARLELRVAADDHVTMRWYGPDHGALPVFFRLRPGVDATEGLYGLGEVFDQVEHRGKVRAMNFEGAPLESSYNEAHVPIPLLIGTKGWGVFVESMRPGVFAVATEQDDAFKVTFGLGAAGGDGLLVHLYAAAHPLDITKHYYETTGYPGPVAPWALGPWIWRDEVDGQVAVEADLMKIRELDLATTGYWIDRPYANGVNTFDFHSSKYDDPDAMMNVAAALGYAMALWHTPYIDDGDDKTAGLLEEAETKGYFPPEQGTAAGPWGPPLDYTNPEAYAWWQELLQPYKDMGIVGYKLDYAEETIVGAVGVRFPWLFHDGSDELTMHRRYQYLYHKAYAEMLPPDGGFLLVRAGVYGDQTLGSIVWPGDIDATFDRHGDLVPDGDTEYRAVGGLPAAIIAGSSLGPSGYPLFAADTGGYRHSPPTKEVYLRWIQQSAFSPAMQVGTNTNDLPWEFGAEDVFDEEIVDIYRRYARLHLRLWPFLWTHWKDVAVTGRPIQRPVGLAFPELGEHPSFDYLLGDDLFVAPVITAGATTRELLLPPGTWLDWWTGAPTEGSATVTSAAPIDTVPVYIRAGALVPMLRPTIDGYKASTDPTLETFEAAAGPLHVLVAPGADGSFTVYDGTVVSQTKNGADLALSRTAGTVFGDAVVFEVYAAAAPASVGDLTNVADLDALTAADRGWVHTADRGGTVWIKLSAGDPSVSLSLAD